MSTVGIDNILANQGSTATTTAKAKNTAGGLRSPTFGLLIKQLQYRPSNPVENTEFTAQLAQFSSLRRSRT